MATVFISHVEEDGQTAIALAQGLEQGGYAAWRYERDAVAGVSYLLQTGNEIARCEGVVLIISAHSLGSHQVGKEVVRAHEEGKPIFPVLADLSDADYKRRQPEWRQAIGAATSISLGRGIEAVTTSILQGLQRFQSATNRPTCQGPTGSLVEGPDRELWIVQESEVEVFRTESDLGGMHDPAWRIGQRVRIKLIYLGREPIYALSANMRVAEAEPQMVRLGDTGIGSVTSIDTVRQGDTCNLFAFAENGVQTVILLQWATSNGIRRMAELTFSVISGSAAVAPTRLAGRDVPHSEQQ